MEVTEYLVQTVGTCGGSDIALCIGQIARLQGKHTKISLCLGQVGRQTLGLLEILLGGIVVATGILDGCQVIIGAGIVGIDLCGQFVDILFFVEVLLQGSAIEQFLNGELGGIVLDLSENLVVGTAHGLVIDGKAGAAQLGQDAIGQLAESRTDVLDLLLTLLGILIHGEDAQDHILVLDVAGLDQLLEAFPVLSGVFSVDIGVHLDALQLLVDILLGVFLTLGGQTVVDGETAIGRCIS